MQHPRLLGLFVVGTGVLTAALGIVLALNEPIIGALVAGIGIFIAAAGATLEAFWKSS